MSFTQVLASPPTHFGPASFYSPALYTDVSDYSDFSHIAQDSYFENCQEQEASQLSPRLVATSPRLQASSRSQYAPVRTPPARDRTPIRHHRADEPGARSRSRSEALLVYVTEQRQQQRATAAGVPSQSAPNTPPIYHPSSFLSTSTSASYPTQDAFYHPSSVGQLLNPYFVDSSPFSAEQGSSTLYHLSRSASTPTVFETSTLNPQDALYLPTPLGSDNSSVPPLSSSMPSFPPVPTPLESSSGDSFRVLASRPKPQCWDHGCNGRHFSTFSNLLRHQREKSGSAAKAVCPHCGTEFTRTTARNGHLYGGKCKGKNDPGLAGSDQGSSDGRAAD